MGEPREAGRDLAADGLLGLEGGATDVRGQDDVGEVAERGLEALGAAGFWLLGIDVHRRAVEPLLLEGLGQRVEVDHRPPARIDEAGPLLHPGELRGADHPPRLGRLGDVEGDEVALLEQRLQRLDRLRVPQRELGRGVVEDDPHPEVLGQDRHLATDVTVADDTERLAPDLARAAGDLLPDTVVHLARAVTEVAREHDDLRDDHLRDAASVGERRVEHRDAAPHRVVERDLVGADAERTDADERVRGIEDILRDLGLAPDAEQVDALQPLGELVLLQGAVRPPDLEALGLEELVGHRVDRFQEENLELAHDAPRLTPNSR